MIIRMFFLRLEIKHFFNLTDHKPVDFHYFRYSIFELEVSIAVELFIAQII